MAQLRIRFANRSDEEIVQILRGYALAAPPDDGNSIVWLAKRLSRAKKQQEAVEAVEGLHGGIFYDYQKGSSICCPAGEPRAPTWLRRQLSDHFFVDVVGVSLSGDRITNEILSRLKAFPSLEFVVLRCPKVDNDGLAHLAGLTRLNYIELRETRVTRDAAEELARALPENCAIDWNAQWIRQPESRRDQD